MEKGKIGMGKWTLDFATLLYIFSHGKVKNIGEDGI
jgi:hypothetical protein